MATFTEDLQMGTVVWCYSCTGPIREAVYRHQCDVRAFSSHNRVSPAYCFSCMIARGVCKRCGDSFGKFFTATSIRYPIDVQPPFFGNQSDVPEGLQQTPPENTTDNNDTEPILITIETKKRPKKFIVRIRESVTPPEAPPQQTELIVGSRQTKKKKNRINIEMIASYFSMR